MREVIEAMPAGESVAVMVQQLYELVTKVAYTVAAAGGRGTSGFAPHLPGRASAVVIG